MAEQSGGRSYRAQLQAGRAFLLRAGIEDADPDARILLEYAAGIDPTWYSIHRNEPMEDAAAAKYRVLLEKRAAHQPVQYLTGEAWFYGHSFYVNEHVLIPRQDTETLVYEALKKCPSGARVLDLCTGSGCILLSIAAEKKVTGIGADISEEALAVAEKNRRRLNIPAGQVTFRKSDLFEKIEGTFDLIVSNPPYICTDEIGGLMPEVRDHEPHLALDGAADGLFFEKKIAEEARAHLGAGGWLFLEIGYDQGPAMEGYLRQAGYSDVRITKDLGGNDRVVSGRFAGDDEAGGI